MIISAGGEIHETRAETLKIFIMNIISLLKLKKMSCMYSQGRAVNTDSSIFLKNRPCSGNPKFVHYLAVSLSLYLFEPVSSQRRGVDTHASQSCWWVK